MADGDDELIDRLLADGFRYESNGRVLGLAGDDEPGDDEPVPGTDDEPASGEPDDGGDGAVDDEPDGGAPSEPVAPPPSSLLAGVPIGESEAQGLLRLRQLLIENPDLATRVDQILRGQPDPVAEAPKEPPPLPEFIDPDDPTSKNLWDQIQILTEKIETQEQRNQKAIEEATQTRIQNDINQAVGRFKAAHPDLTEQDIQNIRNHTSATVNVPGVMANFPGDPVEGLTRALEIGSLTEPTTRDKVLGVQQNRQEAEDKERGKKLSALSGGTGGTSRQPARPQPPRNWNEVAKRLAEAIEQGS